MNIILKELETLVKISRLFQELHIGTLFNKPKALKYCHCKTEGYGEVCSLCDNIKLVLVDHINADKFVPVITKSDISFRKKINFSAFDDMYALYTLYKEYASILKDNPSYYIMLCPTCFSTGEVLSNRYKDRIPQTEICSTCGAKMFVVGTFASTKKDEETYSKLTIPMKPPFCNG